MNTPLFTATTASTQNEKKAEIRERLDARTKHNREAWLNRAVTLMRPWFEAVEAPIPETVRVTCGWPHKRGTAGKTRVIGECWSPKVSKSGMTEIFISPWLGNSTTTDVLATLLHELVHAAVGNAAGHGKKFAKPAKALGLEGRMTATYAGVALTARFDAMLLNDLGQYPHGKVDATDFERPAGPKKQKNRMIKVQCQGTAMWDDGEDACGYLVRASRAMLNIAIPTCPNPQCDSHGMEMEVCK